MYGFGLLLLDLFGSGVLPNVHPCYYGPFISEYKDIGRSAPEIKNTVLDKPSGFNQTS